MLWFGGILFLTNWIILYLGVHLGQPHFPGRQHSSSLHRPFSIYHPSSQGKDLPDIAHLAHGNLDHMTRFLMRHPLPFPLYPLVRVPVSFGEKCGLPYCHQVSRKWHIVIKKDPSFHTPVWSIRNCVEGRIQQGLALLSFSHCWAHTMALLQPPLYTSQQTASIDFSTILTKYGPRNLIQYWLELAHEVKAICYTQSL